MYGAFCAAQQFHGRASTGIDLDQAHTEFDADVLAFPAEGRTCHRAPDGIGLSLGRVQGRIAQQHNQLVAAQPIHASGAADFVGVDMGEMPQQLRSGIFTVNGIDTPHLIDVDQNDGVASAIGGLLLDQSRDIVVERRAGEQSGQSIARQIRGGLHVVGAGLQIFVNRHHSADDFAAPTAYGCNCQRRMALAAGGVAYHHIGQTQALSADERAFNDVVFIRGAIEMR